MTPEQAVRLKEIEEQIDDYYKGLKSLDNSDKALKLTKLWTSLDITWTSQARCDRVCEMVGLKPSSGKPMKRRYNWAELDRLLKLKIDLWLEVKEDEAKGIRGEELRDIEKIIEERVDEIKAFTNLASTLKETTILSLSLLKDNLTYAYRMSMFYTKQIELTIEAAGGMEKLTKDHAAEIQEYEKKVNKYLESVKYAINPNSIFNNLKMLGYSSELLKVNENTEVMTADHIQKLLTEMVKNEGVTKKPFEQLIAETDYADVELPSIDGRANKTNESDARKNIQ